MILLVKALLCITSARTLNRNASRDGVFFIFYFFYKSTVRYLVVVGAAIFFPWREISQGEDCIFIFYFLFFLPHSCFVRLQYQGVAL